MGAAACSDEGHDVEPGRRHGRVGRTAATLACLGLLALGLHIPLASGEGTTAIVAVLGTGAAGNTGDGGPATAATMGGPVGVAFDAAGNLYVADATYAVIRKVDPAGQVTRFAGTGTAGFGGDGGPATSAMLNTPAGIAIDTDGGLLIADLVNDRIRKVLPNGTITTIAGSGGDGNPHDGRQATSTRIEGPIDVARAPDGTLLISERDRHRIRRVGTNGIVSTVAGNTNYGYGGDGGPGTSAMLARPHGVAAAPDGSVLIADRDNDVIRRVAPNGVISTVAGTGVAGFSGDGGAATDARFSSPYDVVSDPDGSWLVADGYNRRIRRIAANGTVTTVAGTGTWGNTGDGGPPTSATLSTVVSLALDSTRNIYLSDWDNHRVRAVGVTLPAAPTLTSTTPASPSTNATLRLKGSAPVGTTIRVHTDAACTSPVVATGTAADLAGAGLELTVAPQSTTTFYATAVDRLMSVSTCSAGRTYVHDTVAPGAATITVPPAVVAAGRAPQWQFTGPVDATWQCQLTRTAVVFAYAPCSSPVSYDLTGQPDATYTLSVRGIDAAGNVGPVVTSHYTLDTTAPSAPVITVAPGSPGTSRAPSWSFNAAGANSTECALVRGAGAPVFTPCASPMSYDLSAEPDDSFTFSVRGLDVAGNRSAASTSTYVLDSSAVAAPTITAGPSATDDDELPAWSFSVPADAPAGATAECELTAGGGATTVVPNCPTSISFDLSSSPDGPYTFRVYLRTSPTTVGAAATAEYLLDTTDPADPVLTALQGATGSGPSPGWSVAADPDTTALCRLLRGVDVVSAEAPCAAPQTYDIGALLDDTYTIAVRAVDVAGNSSADVTDDYILDRAAPAAPVVAGPATRLVTAPVTSWGFAPPLGTTTTCALTRDGASLSALAPCTSPRTYSEIASWPDGVYVFSVRAADGAGNVGPAATSTVTVDSVAPAAPVLLSSPGEAAGTPTATWAFAAEAGSATTCGLRAVGVAAPLAACTSPQQYDMSTAPEGDYLFEVRATDPAGNPGPLTVIPFRRDTTAPTAPAFTRQPPTTGDDTAPVWEFNLAADAVAECEITLDGAVIDPFDRCVSPVTVDVPGGGTAQYALSVRGRDGAGNLSGVITSSYTFQVAAPAPPAAPPPAPSPPAPSSTPTPSATPSVSTTPTPSSTPTPPAPSPTTPPPVQPPDPAPVPAPPSTPDPTPTPPAPAPEPEPEPTVAPTPEPSPEPSPVAPTDELLTGTGTGEAAPAEVTPPAPVRRAPQPEPTTPMIPPAPVVSPAPAEVRSRRAAPAATQGWLPLPDAAEVVTMVRETSVTAAKNGAFPMSLLGLVGLFLAVQNRIDRNDPKLALAPIYAEPDLGFGRD